MLELIIIIIIVSVITSKNKKKQEDSRNAPTQTPGASIPSMSPKAPRSQTFASRQRTSQRSVSESTVKKQHTSQKPASQTENTRTFVQPTKAYRPPRNAAERYDEWFPIPGGKEIVRCSYCGANNLIPKRGNRSQYTCYFCREDL